MKTGFWSVLFTVCPQTAPEQGQSHARSQKIVLNQSMSWDWIKHCRKLGYWKKMLAAKERQWNMRAKKEMVDLVTVVAGNCQEVVLTGNRNQIFKVWVENDC